MKSHLSDLSGLARAASLVVVPLLAFALYQVVAHFAGIPPVLDFVLGLAVPVVVIQWLLYHKALQLDKSLQDSHYERFRRLQGIFETIPDDQLASPTNAKLAAKFTALASQLNGWNPKDRTSVTSQEAPNQVHNLHLLLLQILPLDYLRLNMPTLERDYRQFAGSVAYDAYIVALAHVLPNDPALTPEVTERKLRADATFLANETRRQDLLKQHVERTRQRLLMAAFRSWWLNTLPLLAILVGYLTVQTWISLPPATGASPGGEWRTEFVQRFLITANTQGDPLRPGDGHTPLYDGLLIATLLALAGVAGASGGMVSVIQRVQANVPDNDAAMDLRTLTQAETAVFFAPVTGLIFAVVLSMIFAGRAISGSFFPDVRSDEHWYYTLWHAPEMAKWLLWAFLAGFSERLVPDMLDNIARQARDPGSKTSSPAGATTVPGPNPTGQGGGGAPGGAGGTDGAATSPTLVLYPQPDSIPDDAVEMTLTGKGFDGNTQVFVNGQQRVVKETTATSLRVNLDPKNDLKGSSITVTAKNPAGEGAGSSNPLTIHVGDVGG